jgi:hypothetical protein
MPFRGLDYDGQPLEDRFGEALGYQTWRRFIGALQQLDGMETGRETTDFHEYLLSVFSEFLDAIDSEVPETPAGKMRHGHPVVFVSHQRLDADEAERIAYLACNEGIDYWLDIHDPVLVLANRIVPPSDLRYPIIIAAIIEMALLNSTHLIAVHSVHSLSSKWVPYELGRVRDRRIRSSNTGGWFHPAILPNQCGDYVHLCKIATGGEPLVISWLKKWANGRSALPWSGNPTAPLPT